MTGWGDQRVRKLTITNNICAMLCMYRIVAHSSMLPEVDVKTAKVFLFDKVYGLTEKQVCLYGPKIRVVS